MSYNQLLQDKGESNWCNNIQLLVAHYTAAAIKPAVSTVEAGVQASYLSVAPG